MYEGIGRSHFSSGNLGDHGANQLQIRCDGHGFLAIVVGNNFNDRSPGVRLGRPGCYSNRWDGATMNHVLGSDNGRGSSRKSLGNLRHRRTPIRRTVLIILL
jgi:hypothetical protein